MPKSNPTALDLKLFRHSHGLFIAHWIPNIILTIRILYDSVGVSKFLIKVLSTRFAAHHLTKRTDVSCMVFSATRARSLQDVKARPILSTPTDPKCVNNRTRHRKVEHPHNTGSFLRPGSGINILLVYPSIPPVFLHLNRSSCKPTS